jgi:hypothetical protein
MLTYFRLSRQGLLIAFLLALVLALLVMLLFSRTVAAQSPAVLVSSGQPWQATYWDNMALFGPPSLERTEPLLDQDWGRGSPDPLIPPDNFSARWIQTIDLTASLYRFSATSDDGIRLYVDDQIILDRWYDHAQETYSVEIELAAGHHLIRVEYYEHEGVALVRVTWQPTCEIGSTPGMASTTTTCACEAAQTTSVTMSASTSVGAPALVRPFANNYTPWQCSPP